MGMTRREGVCTWARDGPGETLRDSACWCGQGGPGLGLIWLIASYFIKLISALAAAQVSRPDPGIEDRKNEQIKILSKISVNLVLFIY